MSKTFKNLNTESIPEFNSKEVPVPELAKAFGVEPDEAFLVVREKSKYEFVQMANRVEQKKLPNHAMTLEIEWRVFQASVFTTDGEQFAELSDRIQVTKTLPPAVYDRLVNEASKINKADQGEFDRQLLETAQRLKHLLSESDISLEGIDEFISEVKFKIENKSDKDRQKEFEEKVKNG